MPTISHTEVSSYRRCQKAWWYRYDKRIKRDFKGVRLVRGEILHEMLNAYVKQRMVKGYIGGDPWDVLAKYAEEYATYFEAEKEMHGDIVGDCGKIFEGYLRKWRKDPLKYEASELDLFFDLPGANLRFAGFIDKVATDREGRRWLVDHKFVATIPTANDQFMELQLLLYVWALALHKPELKIDGVMWDYARAKAPTEPEILKSGELSKRKNIDCDVYTYRQAIRRAGLKEEDYTDMLEMLEGKEDTFFQRSFLPKPSADMIAEVVEDFMATAAEIQAKRKPSARCVRSMSAFNCNACEFRPLCEAEVRGHDTEFILKSEYVQREVAESK